WLCRALRSRARAVLRFGDARSWASGALAYTRASDTCSARRVHAALLRRRREALRAGRASGPRAALLQRRRPSADARSSRWSRLAQDESKSQTRDARHGRRAFAFVRRAQAGGGPCLSARRTLATRIRRGIPIYTHTRSGNRYRRCEGRHADRDTNGSPVVWR